MQTVVFSTTGRDSLVLNAVPLSAWMTTFQLGVSLLYSCFSTNLTTPRWTGFLCQSHSSSFVGDGRCCCRGSHPGTLLFIGETIAAGAMAPAFVNLSRVNYLMELGDGNRG